MSLSLSLLNLLSFPGSPARRRRNTASLSPAMEAPLENRELLSSLHAAAAPPADFEGNWRINGNNLIILSLQQDGRKVTGNYSSLFFSYQSSGKVKGNVLTLHGKNTVNFDGRFKAKVELTSAATFTGEITTKTKGDPKFTSPFNGEFIS